MKEFKLPNKILLNYLSRIWINFFIVIFVTGSYIFFGMEKPPISSIFFTFFLEFVMNFMLLGFFSFLLFKSIEKTYLNRSFDRFEKKIINLPLKSAVLVGIVNLQYVFMIILVGIKENSINDIRIIELLDFLISIFYSYLIIPFYYTLISVESLNFKIKDFIFNDRVILLKPKGKKIWKELLFSLTIVSVLPVTSLITTLASSGFFNNEKDVTGYSIATIIILLFGIFITIIFRTSSLTLPIIKLKNLAEEIKKGNYDNYTPVITDNEMGELALTFNKMTEGLKEREQIRDIFGKMVDPAVRDHILKGNYNLGGAVSIGTILFCDIRNFTTLSENMPPEKVVALLNKFFDKMGKCITDNGGLVNKFIGDAIMALFGIPIESDTHADSAINSAIKMIKELKELNKEFIRDGFPELKIGIGIHTGKVLAGNIGSATRMEYTVIGDSVNLASRIEGLTKDYSKEILISENTYNEIKNKSNYNIIFSIESNVKGRNIPVKLYEVAEVV